MLRTFLILAGFAASVVGGGLVVVGVRSPGVPLLIAGSVIALGTLFERWRYRGDQPRPGSPWERTGERFEDPQTGRTVDVYFDPRSGQRRYVSEDAPKTRSNRTA